MAGLFGAFRLQTIDPVFVQVVRFLKKSRGVIELPSETQRVWSLERFASYLSKGRGGRAGCLIFGFFSGLDARYTGQDPRLVAEAERFLSQDQDTNPETAGVSAGGGLAAGARPQDLDFGGRAVLKKIQTWL